jgi:multisubunit Na+/H+ antiporter MnhG subunit
MAQQVAVDVLLGLAVLLAGASSLGVLLMPDVVRKLHYMAPVGIVAPVMVALAVTVKVGWASNTTATWLTVLFLAMTGPVLTHAAARARSAGSWAGEEGKNGCATVNIKVEHGWESAMGQYGDHACKNQRRFGLARPGAGSGAVPTLWEVQLWHKHLLTGAGRGSQSRAPLGSGSWVLPLSYWGLGQPWSVLLDRSLVITQRPRLPGLGRLPTGYCTCSLGL